MSDKRFHKEEIICYECNKVVYFRSECPKLNKFAKRKEKKKAILAAWGESDLSSEEEKEENEVANLCLMAKEDSNEMTLPKILSLLMNYFHLLKT